MTVDFDLSELQSLVRVVTLICKDQHGKPILEGLKCLRVGCWEWMWMIDLVYWQSYSFAGYSWLDRVTSIAVIPDCQRLSS